MAIFASTTLGTSDPLKAFNIKALEQRQKDIMAQQASAEAKMFTPETTQTPIQGLAQVANVAADAIKQRHVDEAVAAQRDAFARNLAGVDWEKGPTAQQIAGMSSDPETMRAVIQTLAENRRAFRGQDVTVRGQDVTAGTTVRGQDVQARGQDVNANVAVRGQDVGAQTAQRGQDVQVRGQDVGAQTAQRGQDVQVRGQDVGAQTAQRGQDVTVRGQDVGAQTAQRGQDVTVRGQDVGAQTAQRGQDVAVRGQDVTSADTQRGQNITADTATRGQDVQVRGQDIGAQTAQRGQDVQVRGQDVGQDTAVRGQNMTQDTAVRGQNMTQDTAVRGQDVTARGQDIAAATAEAQIRARAEEPSSDIGKIYKDAGIPIPHDMAEKAAAKMVQAAPGVIKSQGEALTGYKVSSQALDKLDRANQLLKEGINTGPWAAQKTMLGGALEGRLGTEEANARAQRTNSFNSILNENTIKEMSATLKGQDSNYEMQKFIEINNNPNSKPEDRVLALQRLITSARIDRAVHARALRELGAGDAIRGVDEELARGTGSVTGGGGGAATGGGGGAATGGGGADRVVEGITEEEAMKLPRNTRWKLKDGRTGVTE